MTISRHTALLIASVALVLSATGCIQRDRAADDRAAAASSVAAAKYDTSLIAHGATLSAIGDCNVCHTTEDGLSFAGGRRLSTPFGGIYATNITPHADTGIGRWTPRDFRRAMKEGIDPAGRQLYPAFPYDHYTHVTDDDVDAIFAYLMTRTPVRAETPPNDVIVPRPLVAGWKALYFRQGAIPRDPAQSDEWNRGRYLVDGLGHCGGCHTPRNVLGAEDAAQDLSGGTVDAWRAPALNERVAAPTPWTVEQMTTYLRTGFDEQHGIAAGPMAPVAHNLRAVDPADVRAISVYIVQRMGPRASAATHVADVTVRENRSGAATYDAACAGCHDRARRGIALDRSTTVTDISPGNLVRITLEGIAPASEDRGRIMPAFRGTFTDEQLVALVDYIRVHYGHMDTWPTTGAAVGAMQREAQEKKS